MMLCARLTSEGACCCDGAGLVMMDSPYCDDLEPVTGAGVTDFGRGAGVIDCGLDTGGVFCRDEAKTSSANRSVTLLPAPSEGGKGFSDESKSNLDP
jgi:hypothetical protein